MKGFALIFNRRETFSGYPYINIYNLIEVEEDKEEWSTDLYYVLKRSTIEIPIGSWEECDDYEHKVDKKIKKLDLKGKYLQSNEVENYYIYNAETKESFELSDYQEYFENALKEFVCSEFILRP